METGQYTIQVRTILENYYLQNNPNLTPWQVQTTKPSVLCKAEWNNVFDFDFPMFDGMTKQQLCTQILMHYYTREIGLETVALWKQFLETRMNEIMPYYVKLAQAQISMADAFISKSITETIKKDGEENTDKNTKGTQTGKVDATANGTVNTNNSGEIDTTLSGSTEKTGTGKEDETVSREVDTTGKKDNTRNRSLDEEKTSEDNSTKTTINTGKLTSEESGETEKTLDSTTNQVDNGTVNKDNDNKEFFSDTPQNGLENVINGTYLSSAKINQATGFDSTHNESDITNTATEKITDSRNREENSSGSTTDTFTDNVSQNTGVTETITDGETSEGKETLTETKGSTMENGETVSNSETGKKTSTETGKETSEEIKSQNSNSTSNVDELLNKDYSENVSRETLGFDGDKVEVLLKYRETLLEIPRMIIKDLADLFIGIL